MPALANPCCCRCLVFSDPFNRADENWPNGSFDTGPFDSTGKWIGRDSATAHNKWRIASNELVITTTGESANTARPAARHIEPINVVAASVEVKMKIPTGGLIQSFSINIITDLITGSPQLYTAFVKIIPGDCGTLQLFGKNNSGTTVQLGADIPLSGLVVNTWFKVKLCLNAQFKLASCSVGGNWHHGTTEPQDDPGDTRREVISTITVDEQANGTYHFDDFKLIELKQEVGYGYYYGYGYGDEPKCPCCRPGGCETVSPVSSDCRLTLDSGSSVDGDGGMDLSDGAQFSWHGSWSGMDSDCLPDETALLTFSFRSSDYGASVSATIGNITATATIESSSGAGDGTLTLSTGETTPLALSIDTDATLCLAIYGPDAIASCFGKTIDTIGADVGDIGAISFGIGTGTVTVGGVSISHNLFAGCGGDCGGESTIDCPACFGGKMPATVVLRISGLSDADPPFHPECAAGNGTYILPQDVLGGCGWSSGGLAVSIGPGAGGTVEINAFIGVGFGAIFTASLPANEDGQVDCRELTGGSLGLQICFNSFFGTPPAGPPCLVCTWESAIVEVAI